MIYRPLRLPIASAKAKLALAGLCLALTGAAGVVVFVWPARARTAALEARREVLQREVAQARIAVGELAGHRLENGALQQRLELIAQRLPAEREIPPVYRRLHDAASSAGLAVALFQPRDPRAHDYYTEIPIALTAEGTYHQLLAFLERVAEFPRVVAVDALKLTALDRAPTSLRAEMTLATYVYRPAGSTTPGSKAPGPVGPTSPPAASPTPVSAMARDLESPAPPRAVSPRGGRDPFGSPPTAMTTSIDPVGGRAPVIASATLTGIVHGPDGPLALVELPDGTGYILRAGDGIGEARLSRIGRNLAVFDLGPKAEQIVLTLGPPK